MSKVPFKTVLFLPSQAAAETEAIVTKWLVKPGDSFNKGQILAEVESAKSTFEFESPCGGTVTDLLFKVGESAPFESPVIEIQTDDLSMKKEIPSASIKTPDIPKMETQYSRNALFRAANQINFPFRYRLIPS